MLQFLIAFICVVAIYFYYCRLADKRRLEALRAAVKERQHLRELSINTAKHEIEEVSKIKRQKISQLNFEKLQDALQRNDVKCIEALRAYQEKAIRSHEKTNCITLFIKEASEWAKLLDQKAANADYKKPLFFGIPFSIKESVEQLSGGVPFVLTNVPQSLLTYSCSNPIYGVTSCANAKDRTSGGSSGGEGALIGSEGSLIGIGSDVGGSIRYPCHFNGIAGLKPSHLRLSTCGLTQSVPGRPLINASEGPMAAEVSTLVTFLREIWKDTWISQRDPYVPPVLWNEAQFSKSLFRIGYYENDGWFEATPALVRAVKESCWRLERFGHTVQQFKLPNMERAFQLFIGAVTVDGGKYLINEIRKDIVMDEYRATLALYRTPVLLQHFLAYLVSPFYPRIASMLSAMPLNTTHLREIYAEILAFRKEFIQCMLDEKLGALICPIQVMPAIGHGYPMKLFSATSYCGIYNLLDFAAGTVKVTTVTEVDEQNLANYPSTDLWYKMVKNATKGAVGLPVGVQVVAPPYHEETVLKLLLQLEQSVREMPILSKTEY